MDTFFYIHYNGFFSEDNHTLFEMLISYFSGALLFKTQDTDSEVFDKTLRYLKLSKRANRDEDFCSSKIKKVPGMNIGYLRDIMRKPNNATLISYSINENNDFKPMAILVFKNGYPTDKDIPTLYLDGMCADQQSSIRGMGSQLLSIFFDAAKTVGFQFIELASASKQATATWIKKGFERLLGRKDREGLPLLFKKLGGGDDAHVMIDLKHNNDILVCDETCDNLGPLPSGQLNSLDDINNYINEQIEIKKEGGKNKKKHKTRKHRTRKYKTRKYKRK